MIKVATDAGGTFTDLVAFDENSGKIYLGKALTTPKDPSEGVIDAIIQGRETGLSTPEVSFFVHGGTTVINAITERKGVRTALVTTQGFRDVIAIGRGNRPDLYNLHSKSPEPFVPRHLRFEVVERMDAKGQARTPLSRKSIDAATEAIEAAKVEAVAVVFLHAYINPAHEAAAAARLRELLPGVAITASHEISRQWREYERSNTTVLSAYVKPIIAHYLGNLGRALNGCGVTCSCYCIQSNGGLADFGTAAASPLVLVESGPAGGVAGSVRSRRGTSRNRSPVPRCRRHDREMFAGPEWAADTAAGLQAGMEPDRPRLPAASARHRYRRNRRRRRVDRAGRRDWRHQSRPAERGR